LLIALGEGSGNRRMDSTQGTSTDIGADGRADGCYRWLLEQMREGVIGCVVNWKGVAEDRRGGWLLTRD